MNYDEFNRALADARTVLVARLTDDELDALVLAHAERCLARVKALDAFHARHGVAPSVQMGDMLEFLHPDLTPEGFNTFLVREAA